MDNLPGVMGGMTEHSSSQPMGQAVRGGSRPSSRGGRGGGRQEARQPTAKAGGLFVCHAYNESIGCKRDKTAKGCRNLGGLEFAHNCNFRKADGDFCLAAHEKYKIHK